jgi:hypothetical protein
MSVVDARLPETTANTVNYAILGTAFVLSALSIRALMRIRAKEKAALLATEDGVFAYIPPEAEDYMEIPVSPERKIRLFFTPTIVIFLLLVLLSFVSILLLVSGGITL